MEQENTWTFMHLAGLDQNPKAKIFIQFFHTTWRETDSICKNPNDLHKRHKAAWWGQNLLLYFSMYDATAPKIVFRHGRSSQVGGFFPPAFHFTSAQEDTVVAMCLPSRYCIVKYSLISRRESQRSLLQPSCVSSLTQTCIEANFLEYTQI